MSLLARLTTALLDMRTWPVAATGAAVGVGQAVRVLSGDAGSDADSSGDLMCPGGNQTVPTRRPPLARNRQVTSQTQDGIYFEPIVMSEDRRLERDISYVTSKPLGIPWSKMPGKPDSAPSRHTGVGR
ncbi:hypothetical protein VTH06DRAFT_851 [Thermothelomyces fergusii]